MKVEYFLKLQNLENSLKTAKTKKEAEEIQSEITLIKAQIPDNLVARFYKLYRRCGDAVVTANGGVCHGCYINLPSSQAISINYTEKINVCQNCGRFIFVDAEETVTIF